MVDFERLVRVIRPGGARFYTVMGTAIGCYSVARILTWAAVFVWGWKELNPTQFALFKSFGLLGALFDVAVFIVILVVFPLVVRRIGDSYVDDSFALFRTMSVVVFLMVWLWYIGWILILLPDAATDSLAVLGILPHQMA